VEEKVKEENLRKKARKFKRSSSDEKKEILKDVLNLPPSRVRQLIQVGNQAFDVPSQSRWIKFLFFEDFMDFYFVCDYRKLKEWILENGNEIRIYDHKKAKKKLGDKFKGESWFSEGRWFLECPACKRITSLKGSDKFEFGGERSFKDIVDIWYCKGCHVYSVWWVNYIGGLYEPRVFPSLYAARSYVHRAALLLLTMKNEQESLNLGMRKFLAKYRVPYDRVSQEKINGKKMS